VIHHVLKGVGEEILAELRGLRHHMIDSLKQQSVVTHVIQTDIGEAGDRFRRFLDDLLHEPVIILHDYAKPLVVFDFFGPDDSIGIRPRLDQSEIRLEQRIDEYDQHGTGYMGASQSDRIGSAQLLGLLYGDEPQIRMMLGQVFLYAARQVTHDPDDFIDTGRGEQIYYPVKNRSISDP
jgi:hypothetical protein